MEKKKAIRLVGSILCGALTAFGVVASVISLIGGSDSLPVLGNCSSIVIFALIAYYAFIGYKKPHGNLLAYIMLAPAILSLLFISSLVQDGNSVGVIVLTASTGMIWCIAGRLSKVKDNLFLMIAVTICGIRGLAYGITSGIIAFDTFIPFVLWIDICVAYLLRYKEHIEAGLADTSKK